MSVDTRIRSAYIYVRLNVNKYLYNACGIERELETA